MTLTYIFHSGFVLETEKTVIVFDYWLDPAGVIPRALSNMKHVYVLCSHFHRDHFTRQIFKWRQQWPNHRYTYILSRDILKRGRAEKHEADVWLAKGGEWEDDNIRVHAMGSNDCGVSWVVDAEGKRLFHAGDLNNWYAHLLSKDCGVRRKGTLGMGAEIDPEYEEKRYLGELKDIAKVYDSFDVVLFPIDGRIGNGYTRGARQFLERFAVRLFVPIHFVASGFASAWRMETFTDKRNIPFWRIDREGGSIDINQV